VGVRAREDAAEVAPPPAVLHEQGEVAAVIQVDLGAVDGPEAEGRGSLGELHRPRHAVVVGEGEGLVAERRRGGGELVG
jgi:hypothetical protein